MALVKTTPPEKGKQARKLYKQEKGELKRKSRRSRGCLEEVSRRQLQLVDFRE
jgi:hypothetical protein